MDDYERITIRARVSRDANHEYPLLDQAWAFTGSPDFHRLAEWTLAAGESRTLQELFMGAADIDRFILVNSKASTLSISVSYTDSQGHAGVERVPPGRPCGACDVSTDAVIEAPGSTGFAKCIVYVSGV